MVAKKQFSYWWTYGIFFLFGAGNSWLLCTMLFMQLPIYQRYFPLSLSNRMAIGYNMGAITVAIFLTFKWVVSKFGIRIAHYNYFIGTLLLLHMVAALGMHFCVPGSPHFDERTIILMQYTAGSIGYLSNVISIPYLMQFENHLVGAYYTGDAASSLFATILTVIQQPGAKHPNFLIPTYSLICLPLIPMSFCAFIFIDQTQLARLPEQSDTIGMKENDKQLIYDQLAKKLPKKEISTKSISQQPTTSCVKSATNSLFDSVNTEIIMIKQKVVGTIDDKAEKLEDDEVDYDETDVLLLDSVHKSNISPMDTTWLPTKVYCLYRLEKNVILNNPLTWKCLFLVFWSQCLDWGMGDSIYPYACNNADGRKEKCEMLCNQMSMTARFIGMGLASCLTFDINHLSLKLWTPLLIYTCIFIFLILISMAHGSSLNGYNIKMQVVVMVMGSLRFLGPYSRTVVTRLIQPGFTKELHQPISIFFGTFGIFSNVVGIIVITTLIGYGVV